MQRWHLRFGHQTFGPFDRQELQGLLGDGRLAPSSLLAPEASGPWRPAGELPELADLFEQPVGKPKPPRIVGEPAADPTMLHLTYALCCAASLLTGLSAMARSRIMSTGCGSPTGRANTRPRQPPWNRSSPPRKRRQSSKRTK